MASVRYEPTLFVGYLMCKRYRLNSVHRTYLRTGESTIWSGKFLRNLTILCHVHKRTLTTRNGASLGRYFNLSLDPNCQYKGKQVDFDKTL
jgi:hypothetical protein